MNDFDPIVLFVTLQELVGATVLWLMTALAATLAALTLWAVVRNIRARRFWPRLAWAAAVTIAAWAAAVIALPGLTHGSWSSMGGIVDVALVAALGLAPAAVTGAIVLVMIALVRGGRAG